MTKSRFAFPTLLAFLLIAPLSAQAEPAFFADAQEIAPGRAAEIVDGDTLQLADGREVRLVGIQAPKLPLGRKNFSAWPLAAEAKAHLEKLANGQELRVFITGNNKDRHGRVLAQLRRSTDLLWLQGRMVQDGMARVYPFADNRASAPGLLELEAEARAARRGIWALDYYQPRKADKASAFIGTYQIVTGAPQRSKRTKDGIYLDFGTDWKSDFSLFISKKAEKSLRKAGLEAEELMGKNLRVRGWLRERNGPLIDIDTPEQIEIEGGKPQP